MKPIPRSIALACGAVLLLGAGYAYSNRYAVEHFVMSRMHDESGQHIGGFGMGHMFKGVDTTEAEESELRRMFENNTGIARRVENLRVDEGRDPKVFIQSPTLDLLFQNRALITTQIETTADGIIVTQTSEDAATVAALQKHAGEVSDLAARGMQSVHEAMQQRLN